MMKRYLNIFAILAALFALCSCDGAFSGIYDDPPSDNAFSEGFVIDNNDPSKFTLSLDATSYKEWIYINLKEKSISRFPIPESLSGNATPDPKAGWTYQIVNGDKYTFIKTVNTDPQPEPDNWTFALHHFNARTCNAAVLKTDYTSLSQLPSSSEVFASQNFTPDEWTDNLVMVDLREMMGFKIGYQNIPANRVLSGWVDMDFSNPPPTYSSDGYVYILRLDDGSYAALRMKSYMSDRGSKGYVTIEGIYPY